MMVRLLRCSDEHTLQNAQHPNWYLHGGRVRHDQTECHKLHGVHEGLWEVPIASVVLVRANQHLLKYLVAILQLAVHTEQ